MITFRTLDFKMYFKNIKNILYEATCIEFNYLLCI